MIAQSLSCVFFLAVSAGAVEVRGVLEGFYGKPWSWEARRSMLRWLPGTGFNALIITPKDDPEQRKRWREPLSKKYLEELVSLRKEADLKGILLVWGLQPLGADFDDPLEMKAAVDKLASVAALGVKEATLGFDDLEADSRHVRFANAIESSLRKRGAEIRLTFIPAVYWGKGEGTAYVAAIKRGLNPSMKVVWTGPEIISASISVEQFRSFQAAVGRELVIGDNYPVQDRLIDAGRLFWGPLRGREAAAVDLHAAWAANASPLSEVSKIPLYTVGEFLRNPFHYDPCASFKRAVGGSEALWAFAKENTASWLGGGEDPSCGPRLADTLRGGDLAASRTALYNAAEGAERLLEELRSSPALLGELEPWILKMRDESRAAATAIDGTIRRERANRAIVSNGEISRLIVRLEAKSRGVTIPDPTPLAERLRAVAAGKMPRDRLDEGFSRLKNSPRHELVPVLDLLAKSVEGRGRIPKFIWRIRLQLEFIPLLASLSLLENHFAEVESRQPTRFGRVKPLPILIRAWLKWRQWSTPGSFPARLERAMRLQDRSRLEALFLELEAFPDNFLAEHGPAVPDEAVPWLDRVGDFGRLGLLSVREGAGAKDWERLRWRTRSGNGLELVIELKQHLDAFRKWEQFPEGNRAEKIELDLPVNPADLFH